MNNQENPTDIGNKVLFVNFDSDDSNPDETTPNPEDIDFRTKLIELDSIISRVFTTLSDSF